MNNKRIPLEREEPKHKKKSKAKGQARADHKHEYIVARVFTPWYNQFKDETVMLENVDKVCTICGRIDTLKDRSPYYDKVPAKLGGIRAYEEVLNKKGKSLPKYYRHKFFDKTAYKGE